MAQLKNGKTIDYAALQRMYEQELKTTWEIAEILGVTQETICRHLKKANIRLRKKGEKLAGATCRYRIEDNGHGYVMVYAPWYPNARGNGWVLEHRLIMSKEINRPLEENEVVHHVNGNTKDNRIENLRLFDWCGDHSKLLAIPDGILLNVLTEFYKTHGRMPKTAELTTKNNLPSYPTFRRAFGTWQRAKEIAGGMLHGNSRTYSQNRNGDSRIA